MSPLDSLHVDAQPLLALCAEEMLALREIGGAYMFGKETTPQFSRQTSDADMFLVLTDEASATPVSRAKAIVAITEKLILLNFKVHQQGFLIEKSVVATILTPMEVALNAAQGHNISFVKKYWSLRSQQWESLHCQSQPLSENITKALTRLQTYRSNYTKNEMRAVPSHKLLDTPCKDLFRTCAIAHSDMVHGNEIKLGRRRFGPILDEAAKKDQALQKLADGFSSAEGGRGSMPTFLPIHQLTLSEVLFDAVIDLIQRQPLEQVSKEHEPTAPIKSDDLQKLLESFLTDLGQAWIQQWEQHQKSPGGPSHYLCNHLAIPKSAAKSGEKGRTEGERGDAVRQDEPLVTAPNPTEAQTLKAFFEHGKKTRRWLVTEDAGAGKSVFTRRLQAWFCEGGPDGGQTLLGKSALVVRWEGGRDAWPTLQDRKKAATAYRAHITSTLAEDLQNGDIEDRDGLYSKHLSELVNLAWQQRRVVLLMDAFDQVEGRKTESGEVAALANLCDDTLSSEIMIVVTSRPRSVTESGLLGKPEWQHLILKGFSPQQQFEYLKSTLEHVTDVRNKEATTWEEACLAGESRPSRRTYRIISPAEELLQDDKVFGPLYLQIGELLQVPALLSFVRQLAQRTGKFPRFANRADLYWQAVNEFWKRENTKAEALNPSQMQLLQQFPRYRRLLAAVAYQMLVDHPGEYTIEGHSAVNKLKREARLGCQRDKNSDSDSFIAPNEWDRLWDEVDDVAVLTRHLMVEQANEGLFGFKHRGMQEFFAGLYLANMYSATDDQQHLLPLIGQEAGFWPLRFAAELQVATNVDARAWPQPAVCHAALDLAFNPDTTPRPNELRWHLLRIALEQNSTKYQEWRDRLHQPFRSLLMEGPIDHAQTAAELLPVEELQRVASVWGISPERLQQLLPDDPAAPTWVCCPPRSVEGVPANLKERQQQWLKSRQLAGSPDRYWFWQGTAELVGIYSDEQPRHKVAVRRFWMQATTVTLAQYRLFDSQRIQDDAEAFQDYAKTEDCPVITVNWYDAALFACWVGDKCRLPSESEWEFACRAGFDGDQDLFSLASGGSKSLDGSQANFNGKHPYKTGKTAKNFFYVEQTLPVRWTAETRQTWQHHSDKQTPPAFGPNMWGLWQMHGNVWEWCADVFRIDEYATRYNPDTGSKQKVGDNTPGFYSAPPTEGLMYTVGPSRVLRGGSWDDDGGYLRCAFRLDFTPVFRNHLIGFRLCWGE